jgi:hypothetical protein
MWPLTGYVTPYPLISDLLKNSNSLAVVTENIHQRLFGRCYHLFELTVHIKASTCQSGLTGQILASFLSDKIPGIRTMEIPFELLDKVRCGSVS